MSRTKLLEDMIKFRDYTGMYVLSEDSFDSVSAFVSGYDLAVDGELLHGFKEWGRKSKWQTRSSFFVTEEVKIAVESREDLQGQNPISYLLDALIEYHSSREVTL